MPSHYTVCEHDGAILSNVAGQDVYDINGKNHQHPGKRNRKLD